jgi:transposase
MAQPKSQDLRSRVTAAVEAGHSRREASRNSQVGVKTAITWVKQWRNVHGMTPAQQGGDRRSGRIETYRDDLLGWITAEPDITLAELRTVSGSIIIVGLV